MGINQGVTLGPNLCFRVSKRLLLKFTKGRSNWMANYKECMLRSFP